MKVSDHFTLEELTYSETAIRRNMDNTPSPEAVENLTALSNEVLEPLRTALAIPIRINSGYRSVEVNRAVKGSSSSQHCRGQAADTVAIGMTIKNYYEKVKELVRAGVIDVDQVIYEFGSWVHISYKSQGKNRKEFLTINHGTGYIEDKN